MSFGRTREYLQAVLEGLGPVEVEQDVAELVVDRDRRVGRGVHATRDAGVDLAEGDLVGDQDRRLETGAAGLLDVVRRGRRGELGAEDDLADEVPVAGVLEDGTGDHFTDFLAAQAGPVDQAVQRGGEHVGVGGVPVGLVLPGERNPVPGDDSHLARFGHDVSPALVVLLLGARLLLLRAFRLLRSRGWR